MKKVAITLCGLLLTLFLLNSPILGQEPTEMVPRSVYIYSTIVGGVFVPEFSTDTVNIYLTNDGGFGPINVINRTDSTLIIENTSGTPPFGTKTLLKNVSYTYQFGCPDTSTHTWVFKVKSYNDTLYLHTDTLTVNVICSGSGGIPSLTQWGMIILIALIIITGVYLWLRRKPVAA